MAAQFSAMNKRFDELSARSVQKVEVICDLCAGGHSSEQCAISTESVKFVGSQNRQQQPYQNAYNPGWKNHPGFSWSNNQTQNQAPIQSYPPGFQSQTNPQEENDPSLEDLLKKLIANQDKRLNDHEQLFSQIDLNMKSRAVTIKNIENQVGQIAFALNTRPQG